MTLLRETWQSVHTLDRSMITWWKGLRIFLILLAIQGWAFVTSHESIGVSMSLGAAFVGGLLDLDGAYRHRIFSMGTGVVALTLTVFFGAWASSDPVAHIAGMAVIGFLGGFVVVGGPRATMLGVLCMVAYCVFSGEPAMFTSAVGDASAFFLGGVFATAVITSSWLFRRVDGYRELLALFYRGLGHACSGDALSAVDVIHVERLRRLRFALDVDGQGEILQQWFDDIVVQSTIIRCNLIALSREGDEINNVEATQKLQEYFLAVRSLSKGVARVLRWHWFRRFLEKDLAALFEATRQLEPFGSLIDQELTAKNGTAFTQVVESVSGHWPFGKRHGVKVAAPRLPRSGKIRHHFHWKDEAFRHGVRLSLAITTAGLFSLLWGPSRGYWFPMTVAWMAKPGLGDTSVRVLSRIAGTIGGVCVGLGIFELLHPVGWFAAALVAACGALTMVFLLSNYAAGIFFWSMFVIFLLANDGNAIDQLAPLRALWTILGGLVVVGFSFLWASRRTGDVLSSLCQVTHSLREYARTIVLFATNGEGNMERARNDAVDARLHATAVVDAAAHETGAHRIEVNDAREILQQLHYLAAVLLDLELRASASLDDARSLEEALSQLLDRMNGLDDDNGFLWDAAQPMLHATTQNIHVILGHYGVAAFR
jgi:uncharacterized membrane protein YccC